MSASMQQFQHMCHTYMQQQWFHRNGEVWTPGNYIEAHDRLTRIARACGFHHRPVYIKNYWFMMTDDSHPSFQIKVGYPS